MDPFLNSSDLNKSFIDFENSSSNNLFSFLNTKVDDDTLNSLSDSIIRKDSKDSLETTEESTSDKECPKMSKSCKCITSKKKQIKKFDLLKKRSLRKDLYGNEIKKGGNHKVSFKDDIKGKLLVQMTLIDVKQNSIRGKNYKKYTIDLMAKDKKELSTCNIF